MTWQTGQERLRKYMNKSNKCRFKLLRNPRQCCQQCFWEEVQQTGRVWWQTNRRWLIAGESFQ